MISRPTASFANPGIGNARITWLRKVSPHWVFGARAEAKRSAPLCFLLI